MNSDDKQIKVVVEPELGQFKILLIEEGKDFRAQYTQSGDDAEWLKGWVLQPGDVAKPLFKCRRELLVKIIEAFKAIDITKIPADI